MPIRQRVSKHKLVDQGLFRCHPLPLPRIPGISRKFSSKAFCGVFAELPPRPKNRVCFLFTLVFTVVFLVPFAISEFVFAIIVIQHCFQPVGKKSRSESYLVVSTFVHKANKNKRELKKMSKQAKREVEGMPGAELWLSGFVVYLSAMCLFF